MNFFYNCCAENCHYDENTDFETISTFTRKLDYNLRTKLSEMLHLEHGFVLWFNLDTSESESEIPRKF